MLPFLVDFVSMIHTGESWGRYIMPQTSKQLVVVAEGFHELFAVRLKDARAFVVNAYLMQSAFSFDQDHHASYYLNHRSNNATARIGLPLPPLSFHGNPTNVNLPFPTTFSK